jgi:hypothetical protein
MAFCSCTDGIINFGQPVCIDSFDRVARIVFVNYQDNAGAVNSIKTSDFTSGVLNAAYFAGKLNDTDKSQRWYLTETINMVEPVREDNVTQEIDGIMYNVAQGVKTFSGQFNGGVASPKYSGVLKSLGCQQMGYFYFDVQGNIVGSWNDVTGELDPIKIQRNTFQVKYIEPTKTTVQGIQLKFMIGELENDADLNYIPASDITADLEALRSMIDAEFTAATSITTTGFVVTLGYVYGTAFTNQPYVGGITANFTLTEVTPTPGAITITSVTESSTIPGKYTFVIPAQTSGDALSLDFTKTGFEADAITITIP